jgi:hypothetical protein
MNELLTADYFSSLCSKRNQKEEEKTRKDFIKSRRDRLICRLIMYTFAGCENYAEVADEKMYIN